MNILLFRRRISERSTASTHVISVARSQSLKDIFHLPCTPSNRASQRKITSGKLMNEKLWNIACSEGRQFWKQSLKRITIHVGPIYCTCVFHGADSFVFRYFHHGSRRNNQWHSLSGGPVLSLFVTYRR